MKRLVSLQEARAEAEEVTATLKQRLAELKAKLASAPRTAEHAGDSQTRWRRRCSKMRV